MRDDWKRAYLIMVATMAIDLDHLLASPIYDPLRCSIGFHPLHTSIAILFYVMLCFAPIRAVRYCGYGLVTHVSLDAIDCQVTGGIWINPEAFAQGLNVVVSSLPI